MGAIIGIWTLGANHFQNEYESNCKGIEGCDYHLCMSEVRIVGGTRDYIKYQECLLEGYRNETKNKETEM